jgi:hypothetical protein
MSDFDQYEYFDEIPEPFWTARRILYAIIAIIVIIAFLMMTLYPLIMSITQPRPVIPTPTTPPLPRV